MANFYIEIKGLKELKDSLNPNRIRKEIAVGVGQAATVIHNELRSAVIRAYSSPNDINSVWVGRKATAQNLGKSVIQSNLQYRVKYSDLSKFPYTYAEGNLTAGKKRTGMVHTVEIVRGRKVVVFGKSNRGGFVPRKNGRAILTSHGAQMFERMSDKRKPLRLLIGPSLTQKITHVYYSDPKVQIAKDKAADIIAEFIKL